MSGRSLTPRVPGARGRAPGQEGQGARFRVSGGAGRRRHSGRHRPSPRRRREVASSRPWLAPKPFLSSRAFIQQPRGGPRIPGRQGRHSPSWKLPVHRECGGTRARGGSQQKPLPFVTVPLSQTSLDPRSAVASARRGEGQRFSAARRRVVTRGSERGQFPEPSEREVGSRELRTPGMSPCDDPRGRMRPGARSFPVAGGGRGKGGAV